MNDLAEIYLRQGVKPGKISRKIAEVTGYSEITVRQYLDSKYKGSSGPKTKETMKTIVSDNRKEAVSVVDEAKRLLGEQKFKQLKQALTKQPEDGKEGIKPCVY